MADLIDRIALSSEESGRPKINLHGFMGMERLYAMSEWSRSDIATALDLQGSEITQAIQIADSIDAKSTLPEKVIYIARVESVLMLVEDHNDTLYHSSGIVNKPKVYEDLQITG